MKLISLLEEAIKSYPDRPAFDDGARTLTYRELDEESGKVYSYLKKQGIGREDTVQIIPARGVGTVACIIGTLKAGACFVPGEDTYPKERLEFIRRDADCRLVIDQKLYTEIMDNELPLPGHEEAGLHDAAYIIYTSGSTGNPKGVVHEYGNLDQYIPSAEPLGRGKRLGFVPPFYFMAGVLLTLQTIAHGDTAYIISHDLLRNPEKLARFILEKKLQMIFLPPSYIRLYRKPSPYLEEILTGGEPASGVYYPEGRPAIRNLYALSESGFNVFSTILDRSYELPPAGKPMAEVTYYLIDENGGVVHGPGEGEVCFGNEYVRGYLNLPEKTAAAWRDGVFHTGDLARRDEDGNYYILGRLDDMFKINGNRIEPAEIEKRVKEATGLEEVHAKGFQEDGRAFIVLYYLIDQARELGIYKDGRLECDMSPLQKTLPDYMIPSYYVGLESFPVNANGKLDRMALKAPRRDEYQGDYVEPANEAERFFCKAMQDVLNIKRVGAEDDFYGIGGDSLGAMQLIVACSDAGYEVSAGTLYRCRTPRRLAEVCRRRMSEEELEALENKYRSEGVPLSAGQSYHIMAKEACPDSTAYNLPELFRLKKEIDTEKLERVINRVLKVHPVFMTKLIKERDGTVRQIYDPTVFSPVTVKSMSEEELEACVREPLVPFETFNSPLYRISIIKTPEYSYLFWEIHHLLIDGTGFRILRNQIVSCYMDESAQLPPDYYYTICGMNEDRAVKHNPLKDCDPFFMPDRQGPDTGACLEIRKPDFSGEHKPDNADYILAGLMAMAKVNRRAKAAMLYTYSGRNDYLKNASVGMFAVALPVDIDLTEQGDIGEMRAGVKSQLEYLSSNCDRDWLLMLKKEIPPATVVLFNYQKDTTSLGPFADLIEKKLPPPHGKVEPAGIFSFGVIEKEEMVRPVFFYSYSAGYYSGERVREFEEEFEKAVGTVCGLHREGDANA